MEKDGTLVAARMELCRECLWLRGPFFDSGSDVERVQRCGCSGEPKELLWKRFDFNRAAELCHGCAAAIVTSGSRWSPFFCAICKPSVDKYNGIAGAGRIPVGRHSLMNGFLLEPHQANDAAARAAFTRACAQMSDRIGRLASARRARVRRITEIIREPADGIPIARYLECARDASTDRRHLLEELVAFMEADDGAAR